METHRDCGGRIVPYHDEVTGTKSFVCLRCSGVWKYLRAWSDLGKTPVYVLAANQKEACTLLMSGTGYWDWKEARQSIPDPQHRLRVWKVDRRVSDAMVLDEPRSKALRKIIFWFAWIRWRLSMPVAPTNGTYDLQTLKTADDEWMAKEPRSE